MFICDHDLFWKESFCWRFAFPILFHFQCILTIDNLQLFCYKHNVVSYIGACQINSLRSLFKIYTLEGQATLNLSLVSQCHRIKWSENLQTIFSYVWNEWISFFRSEKLIDPWKKFKCLPNVICLHNTLTDNYLHIFSSLWTHVRIYVSLNTCSVIYMSFVLINWVWRNMCF